MSTNKQEELEMAKEDLKNEEVVEEVTENQEDQEEVNYVLDNGESCSRAEYIRQEFNKDRSRSDIMKELDVNYSIVYSATTNMFNEVHKKGEKSQRSPTVEHPETQEKLPRNEVMKDLMENYNWTRNEIGTHFEVSYGTVYGATKDIKGDGERGGGRKIIITDPDTGEKIARTDYCKQKYEEGLSRREIANKLGCDYSAVWSATKEFSEGKEEEAREPLEVIDDDDEE